MDSDILTVRVVRKGNGSLYPVTDSDRKATELEDLDGSLVRKVVSTALSVSEVHNGVASRSHEAERHLCRACPLAKPVSAVEAGGDINHRLAPDGLTHRGLPHRGVESDAVRSRYEARVVAAPPVPPVPPIVASDR